MRKVKFLEEQKKLMMTELNFSIKDVVELQKQKNAVAAEQDSALGEMKTFREKAEQVKTEQDNLRVRKTGGSRWNRSGPVHEPVRFPPQNRAYTFTSAVNRPV
jgi:hypothetical protein